MLVGAALAVKLAAPAVAAVGELVHVLLVVAVVVAGVTGAGLVAFIAWRWHHCRQPDAARAIAPPPGVARAAQGLSQPRPAIEQPGELHLHLHGVTAEDVAEIMRRRRGD
jgi:hypothetical protein